MPKLKTRTPRTAAPCVDLLAKYTWQPASLKPDADLTVMVYAPSDPEPVWPAYWDGEDWRCPSGGMLAHQVTHWCNLPEPPDDQWKN